MDVGPRMPQKGHGLDAVPGHAQMDGHVGLAEGFLHQPDITGIVFDQENLCGHTPLLRRAFVVFSHFLPKQKRKVEPCPGCDSTEMLPLCRSTIFLRMANPMPVPANSPVCAAAGP